MLERITQLYDTRALEINAYTIDADVIRGLQDVCLPLIVVDSL